jgi:hypothetical protein
MQYIILLTWNSRRDLYEVVSVRQLFMIQLARQPHRCIAKVASLHTHTHTHTHTQSHTLLTLEAVVMLGSRSENIILRISD